MVKRVYVEKKPGFDVEAQQLLAELRDRLGVGGLRGLRVVKRYDAEGMSDELFDVAVASVFSEPAVDEVSYALDAEPNGRVFAVEYLPGQFDQRAESASECIQLISQGERPTVRSATVYLLDGDLTDEQMFAIKDYVINPVEAREADLNEVQTLAQAYPEPDDVEVLDDFLGLDDAGLAAFIAERGLAMDAADIAFCQEYFRSEGRPPTITEIKMIDTYWSDHCRHTTFGTVLDDMEIADGAVERAFAKYLDMRHELGRDDKPVCLMDMGTIGAKWLKAQGVLTGLDESEEINACTVKVKVDVDGEEQDWLYLFKNETHNHPTEIEPFGGAATCVGGAIRDPLSGRSYVYQAMRVTGAADPTVPVSETIPGKLPQRKLVTTAAEGYSSYGNQIGLATGQVNELYHPGYAAKRMEIGAVVGATPADHVRRETPAPGDVVVLLGGRTGRDGIGGATGSSKAHDAGSLESCGAEVQKGNAPVERKIQRLFRRGDACRMIKRCNDFGAGGVSVAIGELADGLRIDLDAVPRKYEGLDGTELAISESQERMAVALAPEDVEAFIALAHEENLEATPVAVVTEEPRVRMSWRGNQIVDVSREFLASNGAPKHQCVRVRKPAGAWQSPGGVCGAPGAMAGAGAQAPQAAGAAADATRAEAADVAVAAGANMEDAFRAVVADINVASNKGLAERFDSTIGAATVLMPFGGVHQLTPSLAMVAKLPVFGETTTVSGLAWGFNPYISEADPYTGAYLAVVESVAKLVASGFQRADMYLTFQEYFERLRNDPERWGKPVAAVLGALMAQVDLGVGAIGGKDSMSGSFEDLDVPPTLVSFATAVGRLDRVTSPEFKGAEHDVVLIEPVHCNADGSLPDAASLTAAMDFVERLVGDGRAFAVGTPGYGGLAEMLFKMCVGNGVGLAFAPETSACRYDGLFASNYGAFVVEADGSAEDIIAAAPENVRCAIMGRTTTAYQLAFPEEAIDLADLQAVWEDTLQGVFPYRDEFVGAQGEPGDTAEAGARVDAAAVATCTYSAGPVVAHVGQPIARPRVIVPVFPGTNCEWDTQAAFERAGADVTVQVINNLTPDAVVDSTKELVRHIKESQIVMLPGGFSGGDEPDGSAKFIAAFFRSPAVAEAVRELLQKRDGLMLGSCNGFLALVKLGLLPYGDITPADECAATLTFNTIGRHQSRLVNTRVASNLSPWMAECPVGDVYTVAISHGEGRFVAPAALLDEMAERGQIATQYVDETGAPTMDVRFNPPGSMLAIEGVCSPDGRILGKMGHSERSGAGLYKNVPGELYQPIFESGVKYFA